MKLFARPQDGPNGPATAAPTPTAIPVVRPERTFPFDVDLPLVEETEGNQFGLATTIRFGDLTADAFLDLHRSYNLQVGLKVFEGSSRSAMIAEFRAAEVRASDQPNAIKVRFQLPRTLFAERHCRIVQIDLVYESRFWFEEVIGAPPYLPIWVEKPAREVDVFAYYFQTYAPK